MKRYVVRSEGEEVIRTEDYAEALSAYVAEIKRIVSSFFGVFGMLGLPYGLEAYFCMDEDLDADPGRRRQADALLDLFRSLKQIHGKEDWDKLRLPEEDIVFVDDEEGSLCLTRGEEETVFSFRDGWNSLRTNLFSSLKYKGSRFFDFRLHQIISDSGSSLALGEEIQMNVVLDIVS